MNCLQLWCHHWAPHVLPHHYLQIVENTRDGARTRQRVLATLGRVEDLEADGKLDALLRSGARLSDTALLISSLQAGTLETGATSGGLSTR